MPCNYKDYPKGWRELSAKLRAHFGKCELCHAASSRPHWLTGSKVVLTVHHIDGDRGNSSPHNLIVLCQRCHLRLDREKHVKNRKAKI